MSLGARIIAAIVGFLLFGFIGAQDANTWTEILNSALAGACLMILIFDVPEKIKNSKESNSNKE